MPQLGVNIDHVATLREARRGTEPEPVLAALVCEAAGADSIVVHLREDRRHIKDIDLIILRKVIRTKLNLEMSLAPEIVRIACEAGPDQATLVPEKRKELTTEGGLDVAANLRKVRLAVDKLQACGVKVSLFIDPDRKQIDASKRSGVTMVELHTGRYAGALDRKDELKYLKQISEAARYAKMAGLRVFAGHGLDYYNVSAVAGIKEIEELNIGHSIVCRAVFAGLGRAVKEMKALIT